MKFYLSSFILASAFCTLSSINWQANAESNSVVSSTEHPAETSKAATETVRNAGPNAALDQARNAAWIKANKAEAEAQEAHNIARKVGEETQLKEALLKQKLIETFFNAELEAGLVSKAAKKAEAEAQLAAASAAKTEALLREVKAKNELKALELAAPLECESKVTVAKYERIESEMKLLKLQKEMQNFMPATK